MMVNKINDSEVMLVLQVDHSRIAGQLAATWGNEDFAPLQPYESMVLAAQEHDTGWWAWEMKPTITPDGYPLDYIGSAAHLRTVWFDFYRDVVERVEAEDAYAAYMVSMHGDGLLTSGMGLIPSLPDQRRDPLVSAFVDEQQAYRKELLVKLRSIPELVPYATDEAIWKNYKYMEVFDQFGQFVCNRYPFNSQRRSNGPTRTLSDIPIPVRDGAEDTTLDINIVDEANAVVQPYPFSQDPVVIAFTGRVVPEVRFDDRHEFLRAFYTARPITVTYRLHSSSSHMQKATASESRTH